MTDLFSQLDQPLKEIVTTIIPCPLPLCYYSLLVKKEIDINFNCTLKIYCPNCGISASISNIYFGINIGNNVLDNLQDVIYEQYNKNLIKFTNLPTWKSYCNTQYKPVTHKQFRINRKMLNKK